MLLRYKKAEPRKVVFINRERVGDEVANIITILNLRSRIETLQYELREKENLQKQPRGQRTS